MTAIERQAEIMRILVVRRHKTMSQLAHELGVSARTIQSDILCLMSDYPLENIRGNGGGVRLMDWYHPERRILTQEQESVLTQMWDKADEPQQKVLQELLITYGSPAVHERFTGKTKHPANK